MTSGEWFFLPSVLQVPFNASLSQHFNCKTINCANQKCVLGVQWRCCDWTAKVDWVHHWCGNQVVEEDETRGTVSESSKTRWISNHNTSQISPDIIKVKPFPWESGSKSLSKSDLIVPPVFLTLGVSDNQLAVNLAATQTAEVHHSTWTRVPPFIYELLTCITDNTSSNFVHRKDTSSPSLGRTNYPLIGIARSCDAF